MADTVLNIIIKATTTQLQAGLKGAQTQFQNFGNRVKALGASLNAAKFTILGVVGAVAGLTVGIKNLINAAVAEQDVWRTLGAQVQLMGQNWKEAEQRVRDFATALQETTRYGDDETAQMLTELNFYTEDLNASMAIAPLAMDMARTGMFDLGTAAKMLGMVYTGNVEILGRYIPELKGLKEKLGESATEAEKAQYAFDVIAKKVAGLSTTTETTADKMARLNNKIGDIKEALGTYFLPAVQTAATWLTTFLGELERGAPLMDSFAEATKKIDIEGKVQKPAQTGADVISKIQTALESGQLNAEETKKAIELLERATKAQNEAFDNYVEMGKQAETDTTWFGKITTINRKKGKEFEKEAERINTQLQTIQDDAGFEAIQRANRQAEAEKRIREINELLNKKAEEERKNAAEKAAKETIDGIRKTIDEYKKAMADIETTALITSEKTADTIKAKADASKKAIDALIKAGVPANSGTIAEIKKQYDFAMGMLKELDKREKRAEGRRGKRKEPGIGGVEEDLSYIETRNQYRLDQIAKARAQAAFNMGQLELGGEPETEEQKVQRLQRQLEINEKLRTTLIGLKAEQADILSINTDIVRIKKEINDIENEHENKIKDITESSKEQISALETEAELAGRLGNEFDKASGMVRILTSEFLALKAAGDEAGAAKIFTELQKWQAVQRTQEATEKTKAEAKRQSEAITRHAQDLYDADHRAISDAVRDGLQSGKGFFKSFADSLKQTLQQRVIDSIADQLATQMLGARPGTQPAAGGGNTFATGMSFMAAQAGAGGAGGAGGAAGAAGGFAGFAGKASPYIAAALLISSFMKRGGDIPQSGVKQIFEGIQAHGGGLDVLRGSDIYQRASFSARNIEGDITRKFTEPRMTPEVIVRVAPSKDFAVTTETRWVSRAKANEVRGVPGRTNFNV